MPKKNRLAGSEIRSIHSPRRFYGSLFTLSVSNTGTEPKFSCVVSKKVAPKAVDRNVIKRRMRPVITSELSRIPPGAYVFSARKQAFGASFQAIQKDIRALIACIRGA